MTLKTTELKTTKEQRDGILNRGYLPHTLPLGVLEDLCHDANKAGEWEEEAAHLSSLIRHYEDTICSSTGRPYWLESGAFAQEVDCVRVGTVLKENADLRAKLDAANAAARALLEWEMRYPTGTIYNSTESYKLELELTACIERFRALKEQEKKG